MDRYCEFCVNLRSVVYCKADAAYLCLPCDTKVHSANPLSNRHHRTLICESCRRRPTYVRCYDHHKFMCRGCDLTQHDANSSQHRKRVMINGYVGSPSAQDLGILWGFDLNRFLDDRSVLNNHRFGSNSSSSANTSVVGLESGTLGSIDEHIKEVCGGIQEFVVLQQLVDLLKVQTSDIDHISAVTRRQDHKPETDVHRFSQQFLLGGGSPRHHEIGLDPCSSPFTQLDHLESSETEETGLHGDSFWQCKSPVPSSQLWSQNMQDLGVCEEPACLDDLNIPDIDLTFRNFEELFRTDQDPTSICQDTSTASSFTITESSPKKASYASEIVSFSHSRLNAESSGTMCRDSGIPPSCGSTEHHESAKSKRKKNVE
ncbi:Zinc finger, B-box, partial [Cynara cardunculus var. scolymus]